MARRVQILHPVPLVLMLQRDAIVPIIRNPDPVHHGPVDRKHVRRLLLVPVAERRPPVGVLDVGELTAGVRVEVRHEGEGVVVDDLGRVAVGEGFEGGFEGGVGGADDGAQGVPFRGGVDAEPVGPEGREVLRVEVGHEDVGGAGVEQRGDEVGDLGGDVAGEFVVEGRGVEAEGPVVRGVHVVGADPQEMEGVLVHAPLDVVVDLDLGARGPPARCAELAVIEPRPVREAGAEVGLLHGVVDGGAEVASSPRVPEGEVLVHGHAEEVGEIGNRDRSVGPSFGAVDLVPVNYICRIVGCDIVGVTAVPVI